MKYIIALLLIIACVFGRNPKIVPEVFSNADFIAKQKANVLILLKEQVNFDNLKNMNGIHVKSLPWDERGRVVLEAVRNLFKKFLIIFRFQNWPKLVKHQLLKS